MRFSAASSRSEGDILAVGAGKSKTPLWISTPAFHSVPMQGRSGETRNEGLWKSGVPVEISRRSTGPGFSSRTGTGDKPGPVAPRYSTGGVADSVLGADSVSDADSDSVSGAASDTGSGGAPPSRATTTLTVAATL